MRRGQSPSLTERAHGRAQSNAALAGCTRASAQCAMHTTKKRALHTWGAPHARVGRWPLALTGKRGGGGHGTAKASGATAGSGAGFLPARRPRPVPTRTCGACWHSRDWCAAAGRWPGPGRRAERATACAAGCPAAPAAGWARARPAATAVGPAGAGPGCSHRTGRWGRAAPRSVKRGGGAPALRRQLRAPAHSGCPELLAERLAGMFEHGRSPALCAS